MPVAPPRFSIARQNPAKSHLVQTATALLNQVWHAAHCRSTRPASSTALSSAYSHDLIANAQAGQDVPAVQQVLRIVPRAELAAVDIEVADCFVVAEVERADWKAAVEYAGQERACWPEAHSIVAGAVAHVDLAVVDSQAEAHSRPEASPVVAGNPAEEHQARDGEVLFHASCPRDRQVPVHHRAHDRMECCIRI